MNVGQLWAAPNQKHGARSQDPTYTTPLATAGEEAGGSGGYVVPERSIPGVQGVHVILPGPDVHHAVGHHSEPDVASPPVVYRHRSAPVSAFKAYT